MKTTVALLLFAGLAIGEQSVVEVAPVAPVRAKAGASTQAVLVLKIAPGYHVNSNTPSDPFLIPLRLTLTGTAVEKPLTVFPKAANEKYSFSEKTLSVFTGDVRLVTQFHVPAGTPPGPNEIKGRIHYQACNDHECLTPKSIEVSVPLEIIL